MINYVKYFVTMLIAGTLFTKTSDAKPITSECKPLSVEDRNAYLQNISEGYQNLHWSFMLLPSLQEAAKEELPHANYSAVTNMARETFLYGEHRRTCPKKNIRRVKKLCPVHYVIQNDPNRLPENIVHVRCNCKYCSQNNESMLTWKCQKEYVYTTVWRRMDGDCRYKKVTEHVAIACACMNKTKVILART